MVTRVRSTPSRASTGEEDTHPTGSVAIGSAPSDYVEKNRAAWDRWAVHYTATGRKAWTEKELRWGIWGVPESELGLLTKIPQAADVVELGCGTASISSWLARGGLHPVAVDVSRTQ